MKGFITFLLMVGISTFFGVAYSNPLLAILIFMFLWIIVATAQRWKREDRAKVAAKQLLKKELPDKIQLDKTIQGLSSADDEESRELVRRLMAKQDIL